MLAAARKRQRLFRRRLHRARLAPPAAPVAPDATSPTPALCLLRGREGGQSPRASRKRQPPSAPASPTSSRGQPFLCLRQCRWLISVNQAGPRGPSPETGVPAADPRLYLWLRVCTWDLPGTCPAQPRAARWGEGCWAPPQGSRPRWVLWIRGLRRALPLRAWVVVPKVSWPLRGGPGPSLQPP